MPTQLFALILEDNLADFELIANELARFGFHALCKRVETEADYTERLREMPDIVLANNSLTGFDNLRALEILHRSGLVIPFIVLTGTFGEDEVVECMQKGATDYLLKDRILRLGRALEEGELRRQKISADEALRRRNIQLEEQYHRAQAASRMKSIFLANMSHELRTPLTAVIGFAELLVDGKVGPLAPQQLDFTRDILANGKHLLSLINDVLDLARVESGTMAFHPERLCLPDLIRETIAGFRLQASERDITLTTDVQMSAIEVFLDPRKLKQVLLNYVSNALKFTPSGGRVTVHAHFEEGSTFRLEVEDTGMGIAAHDIGRLFQDFHQLGGSQEVQGTGLGLALTKRLVEAQGGKVGVVSQSGRGSRFYADLPCSAEWIQTDLKRLQQVAAANSAAEYSEVAPQAAGVS
jgi:signal transduction histidine kinase